VMVYFACGGGTTELRRVALSLRSFERFASFETAYAAREPTFQGVDTNSPRARKVRAQLYAIQAVVVPRTRLLY
jgi:hypothetical protein